MTSVGTEARPSRWRAGLGRFAGAALLVALLPGCPGTTGTRYAQSVHATLCLFQAAGTRAAREGGLGPYAAPVDRQHHVVLPAQGMRIRHPGGRNPPPPVAMMTVEALPQEIRCLLRAPPDGWLSNEGPTVQRSPWFGIVVELARPGP